MIWRWVDKRALLLLHDESLAEHGGTPGLRDESWLDSALARPLNLAAYGQPDTAALAVGSPLLSGSVVDEQKAQLTLSNGSRIVSVPASDKQIRGWPVDLLIIDEAGFVAEEIWRAAAVQLSMWDAPLGA